MRTQTHCIQSISFRNSSSENAVHSCVLLDSCLKIVHLQVVTIILKWRAFCWKMVQKLTLKTGAVSLRYIMRAVMVTLKLPPCSLSMALRWTSQTNGASHHFTRLHKRFLAVVFVSVYSLKFIVFNFFPLFPFILDSRRISFFNVPSLLLSRATVFSFFGTRACNESSVFLLPMLIFGLSGFRWGWQKHLLFFQPTVWNILHFTQTLNLMLVEC